MKNLILILAVAVSSSAFANHHMEKKATKAETKMSKDAAMSNSKNIVETAVAAGNFKTLATALKAAGLVDTLQGKGPFTVFAPTDAAFAKLPAGTLEKLLKPEQKSVLAQILKYHVVGSTVMAKDVKAGNVATVEGSDLVVSTKGGVTLNGASKVTATDIKASNGVIHVIDSVVLPAGLKL